MDDLLRRSYEHMVMDYFQQSIKIFDKKTVENKIKSFANGDDEIYYQYEIKDS